MTKKVDRLEQRMAALQEQIEAAKVEARKQARRTVMRAAERSGLVDAVASTEARASDLVPDFRLNAERLRGDGAAQAGAPESSPAASTAPVEESSAPGEERAEHAADDGGDSARRSGFFGR